MTLYVLNFRDMLPETATVINTTSRSKTWSRNLSPMIVGPVWANGILCQNVENAWQYSKVFPEHVDEYSNPTQEYYTWRNKGYESRWAQRYPMGKNKKPLCTWWDGQKLSYLDAKASVYIPLYVTSVLNTDAYKQLVHLYNSSQDLVLLDFDAYDHRSMGLSWEQVLANENKKFGHAFVLAMMLEGLL